MNNAATTEHDMSTDTETIRDIVTGHMSMAKALKSSRKIKMARLITPSFMHPVCGICHNTGRESVANYYYRPFGSDGAFIFACDHHASRALRVY